MRPTQDTLSKLSKCTMHINHYKRFLYISIELNACCDCKGHLFHFHIKTRDIELHIGGNLSLYD